MRILFDTNVVLDVLLDREPFSTISARLFSRVESGKLSGYICATTVTTVYYLARKATQAGRAKKEIKKLLLLFKIAPVNLPVIEAALCSQFPDFEDAVIHAAAVHIGAQGIVTRDIKGFKQATIKIFSPHELAVILKTHDV